MCNQDQLVRFEHSIQMASRDFVQSVTGLSHTDSRMPDKLSQLYGGVDVIQLEEGWMILSLEMEFLNSMSRVELMHLTSWIARCFHLSPSSSSAVAYHLINKDQRKTA